MVVPLILSIETATKTCSVVLSEGETILQMMETGGAYTHAENLAPFIDQALKEAGKKPSEVKLVAVSKGPGSYTGLRIGISLAKGFCFGTGAKLTGIDTLDSMAVLAGQKIMEGYLVPMIDARRMEVYTAVYHKGEKMADTRAEIITESSFNDYLEKGLVHFFGDGAAKFKELIQHPNAVFHDDHYVSARGLISPALSKFKNSEFENPDTFEPFYLKEFRTGPV